ncbi:MAG TPA: type ISP restriction/modification enzyme, partial [Anaerolineaceae bacterium]
QEQSLLERLAGLRRRLLEADPAEGAVIPLLYRPFDVRWLWAHPALLERGRWRVTRVMAGGQNLGLVFSRFTRGAPYRDALASRLPVEFGVLASRVSNRCSLAPLYLEPAIRSAPNLAPAFLAALSQRVDCDPLPEDVFGWLYALLWSPAFRQRYAAWLGQDFPRLPLPHSREPFLALARLGRLLVDWHTLPPPPPAPAPAGEDLLIGSYRALEHYQIARRRAHRPLTEADIQAADRMRSAAAATRSLQAEIDRAAAEYAIL